LKIIEAAFLSNKEGRRIYQEEIFG